MRQTRLASRDKFSFAQFGSEGRRQDDDLRVHFEKGETNYVSPLAACQNKTTRGFAESRLSFCLWAVLAGDK